MGASSAIIRGDLGVVGTSTRRVAATRVAGSGARAGGARRAAKSSSSESKGSRGSSLVGTNPGRRLRVAARAVSDPSMTGWDAGRIDEKEDVVGVLLLNLGGPETLDDVQPFLYNLFADPDIIRLPGALQFLQSPLAALLSNSRAPKSREAYESIGGGSPLRRITDEQANALQSALVAKGLKNAKCYVGMRYWKPFTEEAVEQIKADGVTKLVVLPLYPQFSISTSGSSLRLLEQIFGEDEYLATRMSHTVIPSWYERPGYVQAMADLIKAELNRPDSQFDSPDEPIVFFSAHGVPVSYVETAGDPYKEEMEECVALIMARLKEMGVANEHVLAYQSRVGPVEWLKPYTDDVIRELGEKKTKAMVAVPISFVSEHIETLEEIDMEYRELAEESGVEQWGRVPALDTNPVFIDDLADAVVESLDGMSKAASMSEGDLAAAVATSSVLRGSLDESSPTTKRKVRGDLAATPPVPMMPTGTGSRVRNVPSTDDVTDLLGVKPEPWEWGPVEFSMVALSILLSTMLLMDSSGGAGLNDIIFHK
ncbi:ferrochelatase II chloroplast precursor [Micromonas commoda]|uniref:Ferrochelatase n=1 Tax=Micromonas commoda (strain RCC299 / NOUM17 / CCMP2709) TaxID=296587 RepID=C1FJ52_MICCC|nr:ferrochelatase II chloroplast precursor [Micromonas commoda]ACO70531.1 ferrochelatase II chloroplast precursor [Micromonas commoda]|eukprot:XP_002509273.1 ferrochelatase II chloroplast precursor [Micromonas commoda]